MQVDRVVSPPPVAPFPIYSDMVGDMLAANSGNARNAMVASAAATYPAGAFHCRTTGVSRSYPRIEIVAVSRRSRRPLETG